MTRVYFATNRLKDSSALGFGFQVAPTDPRQILFGIADVDKVDLIDEKSGVVSPPIDLTPANFSALATDGIVTAKKNLLIFVHGFANSFEDAIKRAAFNREWLAASKKPGTDMTVVAFTWPSAGEVVAAPPHLGPDAYLADQARAGRSGWHLAYFFGVIEQLARTYYTAYPAGRIVLLAHSMGNYALQAAVQTWASAHLKGAPLFDETILAAADEIDDSFERLEGARLSDLPNMTKRVTIYYSRKDVAMYLSTTLNLSYRLGFEGPDDKRDTTRYAISKFRMMDCTEVDDYNCIDPPDASHQYYRRSERVRSDIADVIAGSAQPSGGLGALRAP
jgi:esterase/lipase superfamily enzyme